MSPQDLQNFREVWFADFEFRAKPGERPEAVCLVARELHTGRLVKKWIDGEYAPEAPFDCQKDSLFVAYYSSAELTCYLSCGWSMPLNVLDLYVEFSNIVNGNSMTNRSLLDALKYFGLPAIESSFKDSMRELAMAEREHTAEEKESLLNYCQEDVDALPKLLEKMLPQIDLRYALLRGRYMRAVSTMEFRGIPIDSHTLGKLRSQWPAIKGQLVRNVDPNGDVYDGLSFRNSKWEAYIGSREIAWPKLPSGQLALDDDTFRQMAKIHPVEVGKFRELRHTLGQMRLHELAVGGDGRNRCLLSPFRSKTGRNQPSTTKFIFGPSTWIRSLIKPASGYSIAYIDWSQQEFGIAAAYSGDQNMRQAYHSGDPYLAFAVQAGAAPADATKATHKKVRELFKACALGVLYGMGEESLARTIGEPVCKARELLRLHRSTYPRFWEWSHGAVDYGMARCEIFTCFNWRLSVGQCVNSRSLANFPCQANGAEMLRLACCLMVERGVGLCAPIHDAVLIEAPTEHIAAEVERAQAALCEASRIVLNGFELKSEAEIVSYPDRYSDERGLEMWRVVNSILEKLEQVVPSLKTEPV